ncbi:MAG TPA: DNA repair protein RecO [Polyangiaceae bacterium]|jgi:DNA repair protein RecO (recombination protein O)
MQREVHLSVPRTARSASETRTAQALLLRRVDYGDSDLILTLLTDAQGRISALARGARKSQKRFGGALEPMHTLGVRYDERAAAELVTLREAKIIVPRARILASLERLEAAGVALGWVRKAAPPRVPEPEVWQELSTLLDQLSDSADQSEPQVRLAAAGLRLLTAFGWGIDLLRCVSCGKLAALNQGAAVDPGRGGLVCQSCGGARIHLSGKQREALNAVGSGGSLEQDDARVALRLVEQALKAHGGIE